MILAGDSFSLAPVVSKQATEAGFGLSMFDRLLKTGIPTFQLFE